MNQTNEKALFKVETLSDNQRIIRGGRNLDVTHAIQLAFPSASKLESFGFRKVGDDLQIKKYNL